MPVRVVHGDLAVDAYRLDITRDEVVVTAGSYGGRFYAAITLLTLLQNGPVPLGTITDAPRFGWAVDQLLFDGAVLEAPLPHADPELLDLVERAAAERLDRIAADVASGSKRRQRTAAPGRIGRASQG